MSTLFGAPQVQTQAQQTPHETSLNVQSSSAGKVVAVVLGTKRIAGNLIWYGDFTAIAHTTSNGGSQAGGKGGSSGGGGGSSTSYTYTASTMVGLCSGTIQGVGKVWVSDDVVSLSGLGASVTVKTGAIGQSVWPWLASYHPSDALAYSGLAYVGIATADLGTSSSLPPWNWEVRGDGTPKVTDETGSFDIGFPEAITLVVENPSWACGLVGIMADLSDYGVWCDAQGFAMSDNFSDAQSAREIVQNYCKATLAEPVWSGDRLRIVPYADQVVVGASSTYTPDLTPALIIDSTMLRPANSSDESPIKVVRKDPADLYNYLTVEYHERSDDYNAATVTATDDAHMATYGQRPGNSISAHFISSAEIAQHIADLAQGRELGVMATYEFGIGPVGAFIEPMDIVWINEPELGLVDYPVRVKQVDEDEAYSFALIAEDIPGCIGALVSRPVATGQGYRSQFNVEPALANPPIIFEAPAVLTAGTGLEVWAAISGGSDWGGCQVWISTDGDSYRRVGIVQGNARMGVLTGGIAAIADPDATSTLAVDLSESRGTLVSGTQADADLFNTLCYVGGELVSFQTATLTGTNAFDLTYLRRGAYGTDIAAHATGAKFARLDDTIFRYPFTPELIGTTLRVKLLGFNQHGGGLQSLADVVEYSYLVTGREPPPDIEGFTSEITVDGLRLSWQPSPVLDFADYEIYAGSTFETAELTEKLKATTLLIGHVAAADYRYWIIARDTSGNPSRNPSRLDVTAPLPPEVRSFRIAGDVLSWAKVTTLPTLAGYLIRFNLGSSVDWSIASPLADGLVTDSPYIMEARPSGAATILIRAVDFYGNLSPNSAVIRTDFGDPVTSNVVEEYPQAADWPGTLTGGFIEAGAIVADEIPVPMWTDDAAPMWTDDAAPMWDLRFEQMTYEFDLQVTSALSGLSMVVDWTAQGDPVTIEYRPNGDDPMWTDDADPMWTGNGNLMWGADQAEWRPWPGSLAVRDDTYFFRVTTGAGTTQGRVEKMTPLIDAPDIAESFEDVVVTPGGVRLRLTKSYSKIKVVNLTLQDDSGSAFSVKAIDKNKTLGPLIEVYTVAGASTSGVVDAIIQGY